MRCSSCLKKHDKNAKRLIRETFDLFLCISLDVLRIYFAGGLCHAHIGGLSGDFPTRHPCKMSSSRNVRREGGGVSAFPAARTILNQRRVFRGYRMTTLCPRVKHIFSR